MFIFSSERALLSLVVNSDVWQLDLFVVGSSAKAKLTYDNLKRIFEDAHKSCEIKVIDILDNPKLVIENQVMVNPTTIRKFPLPKITLVGDLSNTERAIAKLGLNK